jgi:putative selenate reductase molybdopterin-binding subunit
MTDETKPDEGQSHDDSDDPTRRSFLKVAGGVVVTAAAVSAGGYEFVQLTRRRGIDQRAKNFVTTGAESDIRQNHVAQIQLKVNGETKSLSVPHQRTLLLALREDLGLTGTKKSCNMGQCGACTVLIDDQPVYSCFTLAMDAVGKEIQTVEGLAQYDNATETPPDPLYLLNGLHAVQRGFVEKMGSQCGHCTPGMIMAGVALLKSNPRPTRDDVKMALSGNLCRCGNYPHEIESILYAAAQGATGPPATPAATPSANGSTPAPSATPSPLPSPSPTATPTPAPSQPAPTVAPGVTPVAGPAAPAAVAPAGPTQFNSTKRMLDAYEKATGQAEYSGDIGFKLDDPFRKPLFAKVLRCPFPHAEIISVDDSAARALPGYRGMVTWRDVPGFDLGKNDTLHSDRRFLNAKSRYVGDAIAAVAADDQYTAQQALQLLRVTWNQLPTYDDAEKNLANNVTAIHDGGPVAGFGGPQPASQPTVEYKIGDVTQGLKEADLVIEGKYITPLQCHVQIEPHVCTAQWDGEFLTLWDSQQSVHSAAHIIGQVLHHPPEKIRVTCAYLGGGFGGKCTDTPSKTLYQGIAAVLARKTGLSVRLEYTLKEQMFAEDTRNPITFELKTGVKKDGTITAIQCRAVARTGGYASSGPAVVSVAGEGIINTYRTANYAYAGFCTYTNSPVGGEFRGFGHPQAVYARELHIDKMAEAVGMNPLEFRSKNSLRTGDKITLGVAQNVPLENVGVDECLRRGAEAIGWTSWKPPSSKSGRFRRGLGMRLSQEHTGRDSSDGLVWRDKAGKIHVPVGTGNMGNAAPTGVALIVAAALGVELEDLSVTWSDSSHTAWDFVSDASRALHCHGKAMYNAALDLKRQMSGGPARTLDNLLPFYDERLDISPRLDETTGNIDPHPKPILNPVTIDLAKKAWAEGGMVGLGYYVFNPGVQGWGASFAEVEVDMETGQVRVLRLIGVHDVGRVVHRLGAEAQIHGGGIMGLGYAITEELVTDPNNGVPVNQSLYEYRPLTILDVPEITPILVEAPAEAGPFGVKGLGENPMFDAAAPVANAVYNATGVRIDEIPLTQERVYQALKKAGKLQS